MRFLLYLLLLGGFTLTPNVLSAISWTGMGMTGNWNDAGNWSPNQVPGPGDIAALNNASPYITTAVSVGTLIMNTSSVYGPGSLTVTTSFSSDSSSIAVATYLSQGCATLWTGTLGISANLTNYGEITTNVYAVLSACDIINYGTFNANGGYGFGVYYSPTRFLNHGLFRKPAIPSGVFNAFVEFINYSDGDISVEGGELFASGNLEHSGDAAVSSGAALRTHTFLVKDGMTVTGAGTLIVTGNGMYAQNASPVAVDIAETEMNSQGVKESGTVTFTQHINWVDGTMFAGVIFSPTCVVDVNTGGGHGITNTTTNNGTININANMTFSTGSLINNNLIVLTGPYAIGIYAAAAGIFNHGTVQKPASSAGTFTMGVPLHNESDGHVSVQHGELYCSSNLYNLGEVNVSAGVILRVFDTHIYDGAVFIGAGTYINSGNGMFANNTVSVSIEFAEVKMTSNVNGAGVLAFTGHMDWTGGSFSAPVTIAAGGVVDVNPGSHGITGVTTNYGTINVNDNWGFSAGEMRNYGLILLNGAYGIGIYYGSPGIFNHGTIKKPAGSPGTYNFGIPLTNYAGGSVIVENGTLLVSSNYVGYGSLQVSAGALFEANNTHLYDGAAVSGAGAWKITYNGLYAFNTSDVTIAIAETLVESSFNGSGPLVFTGHFDWQNGSLQTPVTIAQGATMDVSATGGHGYFNATLTIDGLLNVNGGIGGNGTFQNNGTINLNNGVGVQGAQLNNAGVINKNPGGDVTLSFTTNNTGTINCLDGSTTFDYGLINAGTIAVSAGAVARTGGYGIYSLETGSVIGGSGTFVEAANMTVNADLNIDVQTFILESPYGLSGAGSLTFSHFFGWKSGQIENPVTIASGGVLDIQADIYPKYLLGALTNNGTVDCNADLYFSFAATIDNNGDFHVPGDITLGSEYAYYNSGQFNNAGTLDKSATGTAAFNLILNNLAGGSLQVGNGTLGVGKLDNAGAVSVASGATLSVRDGSNLPGGTVAGSGTLRIEGQGWNIASSLLINDLALEIDANLYGDPGASLAISGTAAWLSGTLSVPVFVDAGGSFDITGYGYKMLAANMINQGTVQCYIAFAAAADIDNQGVFFLTGDGSIFGDGGSHTFSNAGLLRSGNSYSAYLGIHAVNTGNIQIETGTLNAYEGLENNASVDIAAGATLGIGGNSGFNAGSSLTGAGSVEAGGILTLNEDLVFSGQDFILNADLLGPNVLTINTNMEWNGGHIQTDVTIAAGATLEIGGGGGGGNSSKSSSYGQTLSATITNNGSATQQGSYDMNNGTFINNGSIFMEYAGIYDGGNGGTFTNNGDWAVQYSFDCYVNSANNGTLRGNADYLVFEPELSNNGVVSPGFSPGELRFQHRYDNGTELDIELENGSGPGSGHDYIRAEETIQLGGTLVVSETGSLLNGNYVILHCDGGPDCLTGTFSTTDLPADYTITYTGNEVYLTKGTEQGSITPGDTTVCNGSGVTLTASAGEAYLWSTGETTPEITVFPYETETYTVTVTFTGGGGGMATATVNVNPPVYAGIYPSYNTICAGEELLLTAYGGTTYVWSTGETTEAITVGPAETTEYYVTVTDDIGCSGTGYASVYVNPGPPYTPVISGVPSIVCENDYPFYLDSYQDGAYGYWSGPGVYYDYFYPYEQSGDQVLSFTPYPGQCAGPATWIIEVTPGVFYEDADGDGYGNPLVAQYTCTRPAGYVAGNTDCDDTNAGVNPGAAEVVNGLDDNCNGEIDENNNSSTFYADLDNDGFGDPANTVEAPFAPSGYVSDNTDCNDGNATIHPGAAETCNGLDDDCDGLTDEDVLSTFYADTDNDGYGDPNSSTTACSAPSGYVSDNTDCNDGNATIHPGAAETCNGLDDDCDGLTDEDLGTTWYADGDSDGYGNENVSTVACSQPAGYVADNTDCDDNPLTGADIHPGATEICNGKDDDCDGLTDETSLALDVSAGTVLCAGGSATLTATATGGAAPYLYKLDGGAYGTPNAFTVAPGDTR